MIERYLALENAITQVHRTNKNLSAKDPNKDKYLEDYILFREENEIIESLISVLKEIDHASDYLGNNKKPCLIRFSLLMSLKRGLNPNFALIKV